MSLQVPLRAIMTSDGQGSYDFTGRTQDGSSFGPGQKVLIGPFIMTNQSGTPASNVVVPYGGVASSPATGPADWLAAIGGKIIGGSVQLGTAFLTTTTTAKFLIAINGTTTANLKLQPTVGAGNLTNTQFTNIDASTAVTFTRGQRVGIRFTSGSTVNPTTVEAYVTLVAEI